VRAGVVMVPWEYRWSSGRAYALGEGNGLLSYHVGYQALAVGPAERQACWRAFLLGSDPQEEEIGRGDWVEGSAAQRRRLQQEGARPARRRGRPRQAPPGQEGHFPQFYETRQDA